MYVHTVCMCMLRLLCVCILIYITAVTADFLPIGTWSMERDREKPPGRTMAQRILNPNTAYKVEQIFIVIFTFKQFKCTSFYGKPKMDYLQ